MIESGEFFALGLRSDVLNCDMGVRKSAKAGIAAVDEARMAEIVSFTAKTLVTDRPVPFGALIVHTKTGETLLRALNAVARENDPSSHAELRAVRLACKKLKTPSLAGYTMYSTCEPCPMCMANALWARLDRVVYGATIADASKHCLQIHISAKSVAARSDMACVVDGPVLRKRCYELFAHPNMLKAFGAWTNRKPVKAGAK
jgi:tRNA(Arg) A34 adenosine deaminase TadA